MIERSTTERLLWNRDGFLYGSSTLARCAFGAHVYGDMNREEMAGVLEKIALLLELKGENPFKVRAYRQGAEVVLAMEEDVVGHL